MPNITKQKNVRKPKKAKGLKILFGIMNLIAVKMVLESCSFNHANKRLIRRCGDKIDDFSSPSTPYNSFNSNSPDVPVLIEDR